MYGFILTYIKLHDAVSELTVKLKSKDLPTRGFQKKIAAHPIKPAKAKANFRKVTLLPAKLGMLFLTHLWIRKFWPQIYSLSQDLDWPTIQNCLHEYGWGLLMPKGQLSTLAREFLDAIHFPGYPFGTSTAPQTFPLTAVSYLHTTSTSLLSICFMSSSVFEPHLWGKNHCPCSRFFNGNLNTPLRLGSDECLCLFLQLWPWWLAFCLTKSSLCFFFANLSGFLLSISSSLIPRSSLLSWGFVWTQMFGQRYI